MLWQRDEVAKIEKMIKKKEMTVRKFEKKWVPHGHIMVYKWVTDTKRDGDDAPPVPAAPAGGGYGDYAYGELPMRRDALVPGARSIIRPKKNDTPAGGSPIPLSRGIPSIRGWSSASLARSRCLSPHYDPCQDQHRSARGHRVYAAQEGTRRR